VLQAQALPEQEAFPSRHAMATFLAFFAAGCVPLTPYMVVPLRVDRFAASFALTMLALFTIGALRATISQVRWWRAGLEMLVLGTVVAAAAFMSGSAVAALVT
jgi:VIT1/CCC1 family predicted Fe2+/Mn2+ transporter